jgi:hypothetical protein
MFSNDKLNDNVGKMLVALDISAGCSPFVRAIVPPTRMPPESYAETLRYALDKALRDVLGDDIEFALDEEIKVSIHPQSGIIKTQEDRDAAHRKILAEIQEMVAEGDKRHDLAMANHPDNGKLGYWRVEGVRHNAIVKASSAPEAIEKALKTEAVGSWESPDATFIGEELPEVLEI